MPLSSSSIQPACLTHLTPSASPLAGEYWRRVAEQPIHYSGRAWQHVSPGAVSLLRRMLDRDCSQRISAAAALQDPWLLAQTSPAGNVLPGSPLKQQNLLAAVAMSPLLHASV